MKIVIQIIGFRFTGSQLELQVKDSGSKCMSSTALNQRLNVSEGSEARINAEEAFYFLQVEVSQDLQIFIQILEKVVERLEEGGGMPLRSWRSSSSKLCHIL